MDESPSNGAKGAARSFFDRGYAKGVIDALRSALERGGAGVDSEATRNLLDSCLEELARGELDAGEAVFRAGLLLGGEGISSEEILAYPGATDLISDELASLSRPDTPLSDIYAIFAETFETMSDTFQEEISEHLSYGGQRVGVVIALTYITGRALYKAHQLDAPFTIAKSARCFGKGTGAVKRILSRIRESHPGLTGYLEGEPSVSASLEEILDLVASAAAGEGGESGI